MGFTEFFLPNDASPALAVDANRTYLWMLLDQKEAIKPNDNCIRIESPFATRTNTPPPPTRKVSHVNRTASTPSTTPNQPTTAPATSVPAEQVVRRRKRTSSNGKATGSLEQAISLRDQLRTALASSKELIRTIKTEKRGQKSLKLALASLKQLQNVA
jgi:histone deacetylase complex regulatory component SIN3